MTQEDKQLLLKDLCARLRCGVKVAIPKLESGTIYEVVGINSNTISVKKGNGSIFFVPNTIDVFPYLRPMLSMTEKEENEYCQFSMEADFIYTGLAYDTPNISVTDWLNAHHFDYRGLIDKGLAIEVTKENNPYKNE